MDWESLPDRVRAATFRGLEFLFKEWRVIGGVALIGALAAGGVAFWWWQAGRREGEAGGALAQVNRLFRASYPAGFYMAGTDGGEAKPDGLIQQYLQVADQFSGTKAGLEAVLRAANLEYAAGRFDPAIQHFDRYAGSRKAPLRAAAVLGKGYALEAKGNLNDAVAAFGLAAEVAGRDPLAAEAYMAQGRTLEALKKRDEAVRAYSQVSERFPQTAWANQAAERVAALK